MQKQNMLNRQRQLHCTTINQLTKARIKPVPLFGGLFKDLIIGVSTTRHIANLRIPGKLRVVTLECPESIRPQRVAPHFLGFLAPVMHRIHMLSEFSVPFFRVFHQPQDQILSKFHDESHFCNKNYPVSNLTVVR